MYPFYAFVMAHIVTGAIGLVAFWGPMLSEKGNATHRRWGRAFNLMMLYTGTIAIAISTCTLIDPIGTHPHVDEAIVAAQFPGVPLAVLIRNIFGWMMMYLAILTLSLAWHGWIVVGNRRRHERNKDWRNLSLQVGVIVAALNCAWQGFTSGLGLMIGIAVVGVASGLTNLYFLYKPARGPNDWLYEHIKALVGAGISVYTAFFAFGAVRLMPQLALSPILWAVPLVTGLALIIYHWREVGRRGEARRVRAELAS